MSVNVASTVLDRVNTDPDFRRALTEASTPAERKQILADAGVDVDEGELEEMWPQITGRFDISDDELDQIAGGATGATQVDTTLGATRFDSTVGGA